MTAFTVRCWVQFTICIRFHLHGIHLVLLKQKSYIISQFSCVYLQLYLILLALTYTMAYSHTFQRQASAMFYHWMLSNSLSFFTVIKPFACHFFICSRCCEIPFNLATKNHSQFHLNCTKPECNQGLEFQPLWTLWN
jgi:hypothetical protein